MRRPKREGGGGKTGGGGVLIEGEEDHRTRKKGKGRPRSWKADTDTKLRLVELIPGGSTLTGGGNRTQKEN